MDWKSFLGSGMESYVDTSMKMREAQQPGEWKPQTMQQAIDLKKAGQTSPGYDRAYIVDPQGGYKKIDFPEKGRVFAPQEKVQSTTPMWTQWMKGVALPTTDAKGNTIDIRPPRTREEAYSRMIMGGAEMNDPEIQQVLNSLPSQKDLLGQQVGAWNIPKRIKSGYTADIGEKDFYPEMPQQQPQQPMQPQMPQQNLNTLYRRPQQNSPMNEVPVISPDGQQGTVPKEDLLEALKNGYRIRK